MYKTIAYGRISGPNQKDGFVIAVQGNRENFLHSLIPDTSRPLDSKIHIIVIPIIVGLVTNYYLISAALLTIGYAICVGLHRSYYQQSPFLTGLQNWCDEKKESPEYNLRLEEMKNMVVSYKNRWTHLFFQVDNYPRVSGLTEMEASQHYLDKPKLTALPSQIGDCRDLEVISAFEKQISSMPETIGNCIELRVLKLNNNQLKSITSNIGKLKKLECLFLGGNKITSIPREIGQCKNLQVFDISRNPITSLPEEIFTLSKNCSVVAKECEFSPSVLEEIQKRISQPDYEGPEIHYSQRG